MSATLDNTHRGHAIYIEREPGTWQSEWRLVRVPSLGLRTTRNGTRDQLLSLACGMIDRHIAEHGDAPVRRDPMTEDERRALYHEVFGRF